MEHPLNSYRFPLIWDVITSVNCKRSVGVISYLFLSESNVRNWDKSRTLTCVRNWNPVLGIGTLTCVSVKPPNTTNDHGSDEKSAARRGVEFGSLLFAALMHNLWPGR